MTAKYYQRNLIYTQKIQQRIKEINVKKTKKKDSKVDESIYSIFEKM